MELSFLIRDQEVDGSNPFARPVNLAWQLRIIMRDSLLSERLKGFAVHVYEVSPA